MYKTEEERLAALRASRLLISIKRIKLGTVMFVKMERTKPMVVEQNMNKLKNIKEIF